MTSNETVADLITRLSEAKGGSRELDLDVAEHFGWRLHGNLAFWMAPAWWSSLVDFEGLPRFTTSVDAILALIEKRLPEWFWEVALGEMSRDGTREPYWANLYRFDPEAGLDERCAPLLFPAATAPLALCFALLSALHALSGEGEP